ncbi:dihydrodipicolinate synthase family protein [soil metagenome]|nr:dihydrodipicolinate synthase family protein [Trueperaceae bacterium]
MLTPFLDDRSIDWPTLDALIEMWLDAGVAGLFAVAQSAEMFQLTEDERVALAAHVVRAVGGRIPIVAAGAFGASATRQVEMVGRLHGTGVAAVVLLTNQFADDGESDDVWRTRVGALLDATAGIDLGLYECPAPYKRVLPPETLAWAAASNRFVFHKDTCLVGAQIAAKVAAVRGTRLRFFNAEMASLLDSLGAGGDGFSGIAANYFPEVIVWLCRHALDRPEQARSVHDALIVGEYVVDFKYPAAAKRFLRLSGRAAISDACRVHSVGFSEHDDRGLRALDRLSATLIARTEAVGA